MLYDIVLKKKQETNGIRVILLWVLLIWLL